MKERHILSVNTQVLPHRVEREQLLCCQAKFYQGPEATMSF